MMTLQQLEDERAIQRLYCFYCDVIDAKDFDGLADFFTPDAVQDYTQSPGNIGIKQGVQPTIDGAKIHMGPGSNCGTTHHNVMNFRIEVTGDTATAKVHYYAVHQGVRLHEGALYSMWGEYDDQLTRTAAGWRVKHRKYRSILTEGPMVTYREDAPRD